MTTDRTSPEAIAFRRAYQVLGDLSPEAPDFMTQTIVGLRGAEPPRGLSRMFGVAVGLAVLVATGLAVVWSGPQSPELGSGTASTVVQTTIAPAEPEPGPIVISEVQCDKVTILANPCLNLIDGTPAELRVDVGDMLPLTTPLTFELTLPEPMVIEEIRFTNPEAGAAFDQSFRAQSITISAEGNGVLLGVELADLPGVQNVPFAALSATWVRITVQTMWPASVESPGPDLLAIAEIEVLGYPAP